MRSNSQHSVVFKAVVLLLVFGVIGCDNKAENQPDKTALLSQVSGNGQLGIIVGGVVRILDPDDTLLASALTDNTGKFGPLDIPERLGAPVIVEIVPAEDGSSFWLCDFPSGCPNGQTGAIVEFGGMLPLLSAMSAVLIYEDELQAVNLNPLTTAVRARAERLGVTAESIDQANREMADQLGELIGIEIDSDIERIPNIDFVNGSAEVPGRLADVAITLSAINAGLIALDTGSVPGELESIIDGFVQGFANSGKLEDDSGSGVVQVKKEDLLSGLQQQLTLMSASPSITAVVAQASPSTSLSQKVEQVSQKLAAVIADTAVPPVISGVSSSSINQGAFFSFQATATDSDGDTLTFSIQNKPEWTTFAASTGILSGTPANSDVGTYSNIVVSVSDGTTNVSLPAFSLTVVNVNDAPVLTGIPTSNVLEDTAYLFTPTGTDVDSGDVLTFSVSGAPPFLTINSVTGVLSGMPTNSDVGVYSNIVVSVSDGTTSVSLPAFSLTVVNVNDAPLLTGAPSTSVLQDEAYLFTPTAADVDVGDVLTYGVAGAPGFLAMNSVTGVLSGTPTNADVGVHSNIVVSVSDGTTSVSLPAFSLTVVNVNDAPLLTGAPSTSVLQDEAYLFTPTAADVDVGDVLTYGVAGAPGFLAMNSVTGVLSGTPTNADVGVHSNIVVSVSDGTTSVSLPAFSLTVVNVNDAPLLTGAPSTSVLQDEAYLFTPTAADVDVGDVLTYGVAGAPGFLAMNSVTGVLSGTPTNADVGVHSNIVVSVSDGTTSVSLPAFSLTVVNVNDAPLLTGAPSTSVLQDEAYLFTPTAADVDVGDVLTYGVAGAPGFLAMNSVTGVLSGTPTNADVGVHSNIVVSVSDGTTSVSLPAFSLTVVNVNDAPLLTGAPSTSVLQDEAYLFTPTAADVDVGDVLTYGVAGAPGFLAMNSVTGVLSGTPTNADVGVHSNIVVSVSDGTTSVSLPAFSLTVVNVNDAPVLTGTPATSVLEDQAYLFTATATDVDVGDVLTYSITGAPGFLAINSVTGVLSGTPTNADVGVHNNIVVSVSDGTVSVNLPAFSLTVVNVNDAPVLTGTPATSVLEDQAYLFTATATDVDVGDVLTYSITGAPGSLAINSVTGVLSGTPTNADVGVHNNIVVSVSDGTVSVSLPAFSLTVVNVNDAPLLTGAPSTSVLQDEAYLFTPTAADVDVGDVLTYGVAGAPGFLAMNSVTGVLSGTPTNADVGVHNNIVVSVSDGTVSVSLPAFSLTVVNVNDAPVLTGTPATSVLEDQAYLFTATATDVDVGDVLTYSITGAPGFLAINSVTGVLSGTPTNADVGVHNNIVVSVSDGTVSVSLPAFSLTVVNVNDAPVLTGTPATSVLEDQAYLFTATATDVDVGDVLTYSITGAPGFLAINSVTGVLSGTPTNADVGVHNNIVVSVSDGTVSMSLPAFSLTVVNVNDAPVLTGAPATSVLEDQAYLFAATAADVDVGDVLTYSVTGAPGFLAINSVTGVLSGTPTNADVGVHNNIVVSVSDGTVSVSLPAFSLTVVNVNDAPVLTGTPATSVLEDQAYLFTATATDVDVGDVLTYSITGAPGSLAINSVTGVLSGTPTNADVGVHNNIVVSVSDGTVSVSLPAFSLTVVNVNDAPVLTGTPATSVLEDQAYLFTATATDVDVGDVLTYSITGAPGSLAINSVTGVLSGTPTNADVGVHNNIVVSVSDGTVSVSLPAFSLTVVNVNDAPVLTGTPATSVLEDQAYLFTATATDVDVGDVLTYSVTGAPGFLAINSVTGVLSGTPTNADVGVHNNIVVSVSDGTVSMSLPAFSLTVVNVNDAPVLTGLSSPYNYTEDDGAVVLDSSLEVTDVDNTNIESATVSISTGFVSTEDVLGLSVIVAGISAVFDSGTGILTLSGSALLASYETALEGVTYLNSNSEAPVTANRELTWRVNDGEALSESLISVVTVAPKDDRPTSAGNSISTPEDSTYRFTVSEFAYVDVDGDELASVTLSNFVRISTIKLGGVAVTNNQVIAASAINAGNLTFEPVADENGLDYGSFSYTVSDGTSDSEVARMTINVTQVNDTPTIQNAPSALTLYVDQVFDYTPTIQDRDSVDVGGEVLEITTTPPTLPTWITFFPATGRLMGTPLVADIGSLPIAIHVKDDEEASATLSFTLEIRDTKTVTMSWTRPTTRQNGDSLLLEELDHYEISYRKSGGSTTVITATKNDTGYITPKLAPGTYYFKIRLIDFWDLSSEFADEVEAVVPE